MEKLAPVEETFSADTFQSNSNTFFMEVLLKAVAEYKNFADEKDCFYIYENKQYIFKTSNVKMNIAKAMDCNGDSYLAIQYCHFDGKVKRTRDFTSLTASCQRLSLGTFLV